VLGVWMVEVVVCVYVWKFDPACFIGVDGWGVCWFYKYQYLRFWLFVSGWCQIGFRAGVMCWSVSGWCWGVWLLLLLYLILYSSLDLFLCSSIFSSILPNLPLLIYKRNTHLKE
jgi:hypothetical protein